jgi:hypothetical protein
MSPRSSKRNARRQRASGATVLEFALVFPVFLLLFAGTLELGRYFLTQHSLRTAAAEAARAALADSTISPGGAKDCSNAVASVGSVVPFLALDPAAEMLCVTRNSTTRVISVTATYPFDFFLPILSTSSGAISVSIDLQY